MVTQNCGQLVAGAFPPLAYSYETIPNLISSLQFLLYYLFGCFFLFFQILQLYQISLIHHGLMMVGPSGSGKSMAWRVLLKALERLEGVEGVSHVIDPKVCLCATVVRN